MKKRILLFAISFSMVIISCGDDDDGIDQDLLIGSWKLSQEFEDGELIVSDPCDLQGSLTFNADGTLESEFYEEDGNENCILVVEYEDTGTWENKGNGIYTFIIDGEASTDEIKFSENTFYIEYSDTFEGETTEFREVFERI
ncbi:lipocalin family protein [Aquimarina sp. 2201CG14-23]|uniref:lipocalin family protein n=1 Tax=Aquimarina mycalae TaxID=3040073 RepID=UPI00247802EF|nr:lipocalin family protein [Aquimarina sp. 2201CG14-23]MDH7447339.1 lipocalin family protein [Aquimarina sp. 2201CG14-23]